MKTFDYNHPKSSNKLINGYRDLMYIVERDIDYLTIEFETTAIRDMFYKMFVIVDDEHVYEILNLDVAIQFVEKYIDRLNFVSDFDVLFAKHLIKISK